MLYYEKEDKIIQIYSYSHEGGYKHEGTINGVESAEPMKSFPKTIVVRLTGGGEIRLSRAEKREVFNETAPDCYKY